MKIIFKHIISVQCFGDTFACAQGRSLSSNQKNKKKTHYYGPAWAIAFASPIVTWSFSETGGMEKEP